MVPPWQVGVVTPAHNEAAHIAKSVTSVRLAAARLPDSVKVRIVVVADSCTDATRPVARGALRGAGTVITTHARSVGVSRAVGAAHLLRHISQRPRRLWIANTDADSLVPPTWLVDQLAAADNGIAAVAGLIEVDSFDDLVPGAGPVFRHRYTAQIGVDHPHVHGANLGVRADAYIDIGGWAPVTTAEDHDLWNRLRTAGWPVQADPSLVVVTSGRLTGRAPAGFADGLDQLNTELTSACPESAA